MSSTKDYKDFILEHLQTISSVVCKPMMGEYLLYSNEKLFGGIYDNQLLVKKTDNNSIFKLLEVIPYKNAKPMYLVEDVEDTQNLEKIIKTTCKDLTSQFVKLKNIKKS